MSAFSSMLQNGTHWTSRVCCTRCVFYKVFVLLSLPSRSYRFLWGALLVTTICLASWRKPQSGKLGNELIIFTAVWRCRSLSWLQLVSWDLYISVHSWLNVISPAQQSGKNQGYVDNVDGERNEGGPESCPYLLALQEDCKQMESVDAALTGSSPVLGIAPVHRRAAFLSLPERLAVILYR